MDKYPTKEMITNNGHNAAICIEFVDLDYSL